jgi:predicted RNase H-like nuclease
VLEEKTLIAVGLDGFRSRWLAVCLEDGAFKEARICSDLQETINAFPSADAFGVDIPIGPPTSGVREADRLARNFVGPRRSSVFNTPPLALVEAADEIDYQAALAICCANDAPGVSRQAFALLPKIREAAGFASRHERIWEVHPEVTFREMRGSPLSHPKKTWAGELARRKLLEREGLVIPADIGPAGNCPVDDVLDAAAAAWSAGRIARGFGESFPEHAARIGTIWR